MSDATRIGLYEQKTIIPIQTFSVGTHTLLIGNPGGNSLLSTVFYKDLGASGTVKVNYYDAGPGDGSQPGEMVDLAGHSLFTFAQAPTSDRRIIARIANKLSVEVIVTGEPCEIGVHVAVVADFPLDPALLDEQVANLEIDRGSPVMILGSDGKWYAWRGDNGVAQVEIVGSVVANTDPFSSIFQDELTLVSANTDVTFNFPMNSKAIWLKTRTPNAELKLKWGANTNYTTVYSGSEYSKINLDPANAWVLKIQSNKPNTAVEIETWG